MGEFAGIAADNWDHICRYVNEEDEPQDRRKMQNQEMAKQTDDAYRRLLLWWARQTLRQAARAPRQRPQPYHGQRRLNAFDTRFLVDEAGNVTFA